MTDKIGIAEYREIIHTITSSYGVDLSDYALTSLKRRFEKILNLFNFRELHDFTQKLEQDPIFLSGFMFDITVEETEMFRDPPMWQDLKENILPRFAADPELKIWLPDATSGDELFSLLIILKELKMNERVVVYATNYLSKCLEVMKSGYIDLKKMEFNNANYRRIKTEHPLSRYVELEEKKAIFNPDLLKNVVFLKHNFLNERPPSNFKLILVRNKLLYFNQSLQAKAMDSLYNCLLPGGYIVIGVNENIEPYGYHDKLILANPSENIYKKTLS